MGTWPEIAGVILLSLSATWFCAWLVDALGEVRTRRWVGAVVDTGRMAFTAYALQVLALAAIVRFILGGGRDDHWAAMVWDGGRAWGEDPARVRRRRRRHREVP